MTGIKTVSKNCIRHFCRGSFIRRMPPNQYKECYSNSYFCYWDRLPRFYAIFFSFALLLFFFVIFLFCLFLFMFMLLWCFGWWCHNSNNRIDWMDKWHTYILIRVGFLCGLVPLDLLGQSLSQPFDDGTYLSFSRFHFICYGRRIKQEWNWIRSTFHNNDSRSKTPFQIQQQLFRPNVRLKERASLNSTWFDRRFGSIHSMCFNAEWFYLLTWG